MKIIMDIFSVINIVIWFSQCYLFQSELYYIIILI